MNGSVEEVIESGKCRGEGDESGHTVQEKEMRLAKEDIVEEILSNQTVDKKKGNPFKHEIGKN